MGCACAHDSKISRDALGEEEVANFESALVFASLPATKTATEVLVFSHAFWMNGKQIRDLLKALGTDGRFMEEEEAPKHRLFQLFRDRKKYNARKITLLGVMLGSGSAARKAEILFGLYRVDEDQCDLTAAQVFQLVQDACEVALLALPEYARLELELLEDISGLAKLTRYAEKLTARLPATVERLAEALLQKSDQVSEVHLKARVAGSEAKVLCSAAELRLLSISNSQPMERRSESAHRPRLSSSSGTSEKTPPRK
jgi:hypothetical protein